MSDEHEEHDEDCTCGNLGEEAEALKMRVLDAVTDLFGGTSWAPKDGGVLTDAVVIMTWIEPNGKGGGTRFSATHNWWTTYGMLQEALEDHQDSRTEM